MQKVTEAQLKNVCGGKAIAKVTSVIGGIGGGILGITVGKYTTERETELAKKPFETYEDSWFFKDARDTVRNSQWKGHGFWNKTIGGTKNVLYYGGVCANSVIAAYGLGKFGSEVGSELGEKIEKVLKF